MAKIKPEESPLFWTIVSKRSRMTSRQRAVSKQRSLSTVWLDPESEERQYVRFMKKLLEPVVTAANDWVALEYTRVKDFYRHDSVKVHKDQLGDDLRDLQKLLEGIDAKIFLEQRDSIKAELLALAGQVESFNRGQWGKFINQFAEGAFPIREFWVPEVLDAWKETNFGLIAGVSQEYIKRINTIIGDGVMDGKTFTAISKEVREVNKTLSRKRVELIARDQIGKLNGRLTERRQTEAGISNYHWNTMGDERVRGKPNGVYPRAVPSHFIMENTFNRWDNSRVFSKDGGKTWVSRTLKMPKVHPGIAILCRCFGAPVFGPLLEAADKEIDRSRRNL